MTMYMFHGANELLHRTILKTVIMEEVCPQHFSITWQSDTIFVMTTSLELMVRIRRAVKEVE